MISHKFNVYYMAKDAQMSTLCGKICKILNSV